MIAYDGAPLGDQSHNVCQASSINGQNKGRFCSSDEHARYMHALCMYAWNWHDTPVKQIDS